jgi:hypothetical protein
MLSGVRDTVLGVRPAEERSVRFVVFSGDCFVDNPVSAVLPLISGNCLLVFGLQRKMEPQLP